MRVRQFLLLFVVSVALASLAGGAQPALAEVGDPLDGYLVCVDPGHGGTGEPGAVNEGLVESEINLDVSLAVAEQLGDLGAVVVLTRTTDDFAGVLSIRERYEFCNGAAAASPGLTPLLLSVHTNSLADETRDGTHTLYFKSEDRALAQAIYDAMLPALRVGPEAAGVTFEEFGVRRDPLGVLLKSDMPAVVVEPVMMSHDAWEAPRLWNRIHPLGSESACTDVEKDDCRRAQIAAAVVQGVLGYVAAQPPGDPGGGGDPGSGGKDDAFCEAHPTHPKCP